MDSEKDVRFVRLVVREERELCAFCYETVRREEGFRLNTMVQSIHSLPGFEPHRCCMCGRQQAVIDPVLGEATQ